MKCTFLFPLVIFTINGLTQNIIPDPGFEIFTSGNALGDENSANDPSDCEYDNNNSANNNFNGDMEWWKAARHSSIDRGRPDLVRESTPTCSNTAYWYCSHPSAPYGVHALVQATINNKSECDNTVGDDDPKKTHDAVRIDFNGISLTNGANYIIRYKVKPIRATIADASYTPFNSNCLTEQDFCHLRVFFAEHGENWNDTYNNDQFEATSANLQRTYNGSNCRWEYIERNFTVPSSGLYQNLILYAESGGFAIDDVELFSVCTNDYYIQNKVYADPAYIPTESGNPYKQKVSNNILAGNNVGAYNVPLGDVIIQQNASVIYTAGNEIALRNGFSAQLGSNFSAIIDACPNSRMMTDDSEISNLSNDEKLSELSNLNIFPNPSKGNLTVKLNSEEISSLKVTNTLGNILYNQNNVKSNICEINLQGIKSGIYIIEVKSSTKAVSYFKRIVIEN